MTQSVPPTDFPLPRSEPGLPDPPGEEGDPAAMAAAPSESAAEKPPRYLVEALLAGVEAATTAAVDAAAAPGEPAAAKPGRRVGKAVREVLETVLLALFIYLTVRGLVQNFKVEGSSMEPTLRSGEYLLVNKAAYSAWNLGPLNDLLPFSERDATGVYPFGLPRVGDIVVFHYPRDPSRDFIKRVVAAPGDTIEIRAGVVYRNDAKLEEPYIKANPTYSRERMVMPAGQFFVLGDNRANSSDSHVWGPVPIEKIVGKAWLTYWPLKSWGSVQDHSVLAGN